MTEPCDHLWELVDESFDHEYGTEQVLYWRCLICDEIAEVGPHDLEESML